MQGEGWKFARGLINAACGSRFFDSCRSCVAARALQQNFFCVACSRPMCSNCSCSQDPEIHLSLEIRRWTLNDREYVIRIADAAKYLDTSAIERHVMNEADTVLFLIRELELEIEHTTKHLRSSSSINKCRAPSCSRILAQGCTCNYCSIACKLQVFESGKHTLSMDPKPVSSSARRATTFRINRQAGEASESESRRSLRRYRRRRKGVPSRAPMF